jgi:membrane-bound lytic murein transglycosylase C
VALLPARGHADDLTHLLEGLERDDAAFDRAAALEGLRFERDVTSLWGTFVASTRSVWSTYSAIDRHGTVDFERGEVVVEVIAPGNMPEPDQGIVRGLAGQLQSMMSPFNPAGRNPLEGLVDAGRGAPLLPSRVPETVRRSVEDGHVHRRVVSEPGAGVRTIYALHLPMVSDHLRVAARPYRGLVGEFARRFDLPESLVLAVIHTESCFNPFARSSANAHGLMQLVPDKGASDAWLRTRGLPRVVPPMELYNPRLNVELGTAYLRTLLDEFTGVRGPGGSLALAIAAYNCGPGCVRRALAGGDPLAPALASSTVDRTRGGLLERVPAETRDYVRRVLERQRLWAAAPAP